MNAKISDFGVARIFGDDTDSHTRKVVGTYGYMSPEYAMDGVFSVKSDVFSFGVLVLEVVSGRKNRGMYGSGEQASLLSQAWRLWREGDALALLDEGAGTMHVPHLRGAALRAGGAAVRARAARRPPAHGGGVPGAQQPGRGAPAAQAPGLLHRPGLRRLHRRRVVLHVHRQRRHRHHRGRTVIPRAARQSDTATHAFGDL